MKREITWWQDPFHRAVVYSAVVIVALFLLAMEVPQWLNQ